MNLLDTIKNAWGWIGLTPAAVQDINAFGNILVTAHDGQVWRICPEDLRADVVAASRAALEQLRRQPDFVEDWDMAAMVDEARGRLGRAGEGRCYCLKVPGVLGGEYGGENLATISLVELIACSGDLAKQVSELPDGAEMRLNVGLSPQP